MSVGQRWSVISEPVSRRSLLGGGAALIGGATLLSACSSGSTGTAGVKPRRGGTLRVGASGGGTGDTLEPGTPLLNTDANRNFMLYDQLVHLDNSGTPQLVLAESIAPNKDFTRWTIKLRTGVEFHNGKTMTATDVLFSITRVIKGKFAGAVSYGPIDLPKCHVVNPTTVVLVFKTPYAQLVQFMAAQLGTSPIVPTDFDAKKPVGTGPFKLVSFRPGVQSVVVRNPHYWGKTPYLDKIVLVDLTDETTQLSALQAGQVDVINFLSASSVATVKGAGMKTWISETGATVPFTMRTDIAPFNDVRVRQAFRLIVDRKQMLEQVYSGYGSIGNDVFGRYDAFYDRSLPISTSAKIGR